MRTPNLSHLGPELIRPSSDTRCCPICSSPSPYVFTSRLGRLIYGCQSPICGHLHTPVLQSGQGVHVRPTDIEAESDRSMKLYHERNHRLLRRLLDEFEGGPPKEPVLVDFGAGDAHVSRSFKQELGSRARIYCIEHEEQCARVYTRHGLLHIEHLAALPERADLLYAIEVIEHVDEPIAQLRAMRVALKDEGLLFLTTPPGHRCESKTTAYGNATHLHFFTPLSLNLALGQAGFEPMAFQHMPEMYPQAQAPGKATRARNELRRLVHGLRRRLWPAMASAPADERWMPEWEMPASLDGRDYPYHLTGFARPVRFTDPDQ